MPPWASRILLSSWFTIPPYYDQLSLSVICICRQRAIRRALKTQRSSSAIAPHLQQNDDHSADEPFHCPGYVLTTVVFFTGGATISGVGEARQNIDIPLDTLTRRAFFDGLFACVQEAIVLLDTGDRILLVNPEFSRVFGYAQEEACGHLIQELIVPEELLTEVEEYARRALREESLNYEAVRKRKDGTRVHVSVVSGPVSGADSHISHYVIYRDITERKRAEQRLRQSEEDLRTITDSIRQPIAVLAPDGTQLYVNRVALDNSGLTLEEVINEGFLARVCHPDDINRVRDERRIGLLERVPFDLEVRLLHKRGQYRWRLMQYNPLKDESGQIIRWYATATDIDDQKNKEERLRNENLVLREEIDRSSMFEEIVGSCKPMHQLLKQVEKVAPADSTVLILGETGTGKELIARALHRRSKRAARVFVRVNCAAIPQSLIASELFGHEKGAFTGAQQRRLGRFEAADSGTLFLDEIGDLPIETQIALLRVLQEREL